MQESTSCNICSLRYEACSQVSRFFVSTILAVCWVTHVILSVMSCSTLNKTNQHCERCWSQILRYRLPSERQGSICWVHQDMTLFNISWQQIFTIMTRVPLALQSFRNVSQDGRLLFYNLLFPKPLALPLQQGAVTPNNIRHEFYKESSQSKQNSRHHRSHLTCSSFSADKFPMVWMFCARTKWPIPRDHDMVRMLGRICSTGTVHDTRSGNTQSVKSRVDWSLLTGTGRRWKVNKNVL